MPTGRNGSAGSQAYDLLYDPAARRDLNDVPPQDFKRLDERILQLAEQPRPSGAKKIGPDVYRIRSGDWRVIYLVDDDGRRVVVSRVKRRNERTYA